MILPFHIGYKMQRLHPLFNVSCLCQNDWPCRVDENPIVQTKAHQTFNREVAGVIYILVLRFADKVFVVLERLIIIPKIVRYYLKILLRISPLSVNFCTRVIEG